MSQKSNNFSTLNIAVLLVCHLIVEFFMASRYVAVRISDLVRTLLTAFSFLASPFFAHSQMTVGDVYTTAGSGSTGYSSVPSAPLSHTLSDPLGIAFDHTITGGGSYYICDGTVSTVYKVSGGTMSLFAGNGTVGHSSGGGLAAGSAVNVPWSVAVAPNGDVYIGEVGYIEKVSTSGVLTTIAGVGQTSSSGDGGPASAAHFDTVTSMVFDSSGNLWIDDTGEGIRVISITNNVIGNITRFSSLYLYIAGIAFDSVGNVYLGGGDSVYKVDPTGANVTTVATDPLYYSRFNTLVIDSQGNLYTSGYYSSQIFKITPAGTVSIYAGINGEQGGYDNYNGEGLNAITGAALSGPASLAFGPDGSLFFSDEWAHRVREVYSPIPTCTNTAGYICTVAGNGTAGASGDGGPAISASLNYPQGIFVDSAENIFIADTGNNLIRKVRPDHTITTIAGGGTSVPDGNTGVGGLATQSELFSPAAVSEDGSGNVTILNECTGSCLLVTPLTGFNVDSYEAIEVVDASTGNISWATPCTPFGCIGYPVTTDFVAGSNTNSSIGPIGPGFWLASYGNGSVAFQQTSGLLTYPNFFLANPANTSSPIKIASDGAGNVYFSNGDLPYCDALVSCPYIPFPPSTTDYTVQIQDTSGNITTIAGNGTNAYSGDGFGALYAGMTPGALAIDSQGNVFVVDSSVSVVRRIDATTGIITTVAGDPTQSPGYSGDGGPAISAQLNNPGGLKFDAMGNLYISDTSNNVIRFVKADSNGLVGANVSSCVPGIPCTGPPPRCIHGACY